MVEVYILKSINRNYHYVGISAELEIRFEKHNSGKNKTTAPYAPFKRIYTKSFESYKEARKHEVFLKSGKGREFIKTLI